MLKLTVLNAGAGSGFSESIALDNCDAETVVDLLVRLGG